MIRRSTRELGGGEERAVVGLKKGDPEMREKYDAFICLSTRGPESWG